MPEPEPLVTIPPAPMVIDPEPATPISKRLVVHCDPVPLIATVPVEPSKLPIKPSSLDAVPPF